VGEDTNVLAVEMSWRVCHNHHWINFKAKHGLVEANSNEEHNLRK
jgi:hypothetical protein